MKVGGLASAGSPDGSADVVRLKAELERLEVSTQEALLAQQVKFNLEVSAVRDQFEEAERRCRTAEMDMAGLREKLEKARLDSLQESEETMSELKNVYEREKVMLIEENKRLQVNKRQHC